jgi:hypothetical protein
VELDWTEAPPEVRTAARSAIVLVRGGQILSHGRDRAIIAVPGLTDLRALGDLAVDFEAANPGARARVVLYEARKARSTASRRLLTADVAFLIEASAPLEQVVARVSLTDLQMISGTPGAFVARASHPLAALEAARALAATPGVKSAYPLITRTPATR